MSQSLGVILLVEDEGMVRFAAASALHDAGWKVLEASSGESAIALLRGGEDVFLLLTDIRLAGDLSGWDVAEVGQKAQTKLHVIYTSGRDSAEHVRRVQPSLFFEKPYDLEKVVEACGHLRRDNASSAGSARGRRIGPFDR